MTDSNQVPNGLTTWPEKLRDYRDQTGLSRREFATQCGISQYTIASIEKGDRPRTADAKKLQSFFDSLPAEDETMPLPKHGLDKTSITLMDKVLRLAIEHERIPGLMNCTFRRLNEEHPETTLPLAQSLLRQYIASLSDPEVRLNRLLELLDDVRDAKK